MKYLVGYSADQGGREALALGILLPIGLSFHTFQSLSYTIEVYRKHQKPERRLAGRPLLEHALRWATGATDEIAIAVRAHYQIAEPSVPILLDRIADIGPISALESAFRFAWEQGREKVILIGCDQPFLPSDLAVRLDRKIAASDCAMPVSNTKDHPMAALWRVDSAGLADYISAGGRSLWRFAEACGGYPRG
ncbi:MAG: NTP transferase domain-containing protein, partial [Rhizobiales bacterium]|nr:NTP transferase domain-containing protein [Hyphomicrobiales bacterium]